MCLDLGVFCVLQAALDPDGYGAAADESFSCLLGSVSDHCRYGGQIETEIGNKFGIRAKLRQNVSEHLAEPLLGPPICSHALREFGRPFGTPYICTPVRGQNSEFLSTLCHGHIISEQLRLFKTP